MVDMTHIEGKSHQIVPDMTHIEGCTGLRVQHSGWMEGLIGLESMTIRVDETHNA
jgi:hypothetical protein